MNTTCTGTAEVDHHLAEFTIDNATDPFFWIDSQARFFRVNEAACRHVGYLREELLGMTVLDINPEMTPEGWRRSWEEIRRKKEFTLETTLQKKNGHLFPIEAVIKFIEYEGSEFTCAFIHDISRRRKAESLVRTNEERYRSLYENTPVMLHSIGPDRRLLSVSNQWLEVLQYGREEVIGRRPTEFMTETSRRHVENVLFPQFFRKGYVKDVHTQFVKRNGEIVDVLLSATVERDEQGRFVRSLAVLIDVTQRLRAERDLKDALAELSLLKDRLQAENIYLQDEIRVEHGFEEIIGSSQAMNEVMRKVSQVAATRATVLILGETGTGKELLARAIHDHSARRDRPLVKINCAALPANLVEAELFGHEKGAFTGALTKRIGRFELADGGTIFLDEIGDLPLDLQAKLLRVLQEGELERLGSPLTIKVDVRVIAATNRDLEQAVRQGAFREDLYYRLNVFPLRPPALRDRPEDIPMLVRYFVKKIGGRIGRKIEFIPSSVMGALAQYDWPGNVRELENIVERAIILSRGPHLELEEPLVSTQRGISADLNDLFPGGDLTWKEVEKAMIRNALERCHWTVAGRHGAAAKLGIPASTLRERIQRYGLIRPQP